MGKRVEKEINTTEKGDLFSKSKIRKVWSLGNIIPGKSPAIWRYDMKGTEIKFTDYGNRNSRFGWEISHMDPNFEGNGDHIKNLQPVHWCNNNEAGRFVDKISFSL